jgi:hypothetical protein
VIVISILAVLAFCWNRRRRRNLASFGVEGESEGYKERKREERRREKEEKEREKKERERVKKSRQNLAENF